jgi:hypothetical protein
VQLRQDHREGTQVLRLCQKLSEHGESRNWLPTRLDLQLYREGEPNRPPVEEANCLGLSVPPSLLQRADATIP